MLRLISSKQCIKCYNEYTDMEHNWCKPCQRNYLKKNFTKWTSGNKQVDNFIQEKQLEIDRHTDIVFEWIPYNQFNDIKELGKSDFVTLYSAIWRHGPLHYDYQNKKKWMRGSNEKVGLKYNLQSVAEFLNEVGMKFFGLFVNVIYFYNK